jgi:hypothetical protein
MGRRTTRSIFAVALCSGVAMVGVAVNGMLGVDTELQRSVVAAQHNYAEQHSVRVIMRDENGDCGPPPPTSHRRI